MGGPYNYIVKNELEINKCIIRTIRSGSDDEESDTDYCAQSGRTILSWWV